ncbi:MBOAT family O-acyltransferase [Methylocystis heyeri]|uniref:Probable alginate O-acetylase AlgI n=1 Tax=Methylocystis heyeri TaxID=391905 RepID=A0A6B8KCP2_9HYPH|nr:MBOAT family protein [Methylocystis heyeri]QGM44861.1 MBOAT family protein [Methylocystis heyeri]
MLFYEPLFLFLFAPAVYLVFLAAAGRRASRMLVLLLASVVFYAWSEPVFVLVVMASVALDLLVARLVHAAPQGSAARSAWLAVGVCANLAILVYYKYAGFLVENLDALGFAQAAVPKIALPIGVSFIVFEKITYLVDVHRGVTPPARSVSLYALYVFFFPKLLAGPIIKYHDIAGQMEACPPPHADDFVAGFSRFMLGVIKKLLLADALAGGADLVFAHDASELGFVEAWAGVIFFTFQIYFDFSGYSDMAIGLARMFGFRLHENFNEPYIARSITEFWRRWHMSLTGWIREYLYFPLGGNRKGALRTHFNLWLCFLASGIWHGAAWTYVAWGAYNGLFLVLDRLFLLRALERLPGWLANLVTFLVVMVGWTIFRANSLGQAGQMLALMVQPGVVAPGDALVPSYYWLAASIAAAICVAQRAALYAEGFSWPSLALRFAPAANTLLALFFLAALAKGVADPFKPFIYFRF